MLHKMRRVDIASVGVWVGVSDALIGRAVIVDDDFIDREDGQSAGDTANVGRPLLPRYTARKDQNKAALSDVTVTKRTL